MSAMLSAETSAHFIYPPDPSNLTFHYGDTVVVEWISSYLPIPGTGIYLSLGFFCGPQNFNPLNINVTTNGTKPISFINLDFEGWILPLECHFELDFNDIKKLGSQFTLDDQDPNLLPSTWATTTAVTTTSTPSSSVTIAPTPTSLSKSSSIPAPTPDTTLTPAPSPTTQIATRSITTSEITTTTDPDHSRSSGLGSGAKAGIGVSSTVGGLALLAALAYLLVRSKKAGQVSSPEPHRREDERRSNIVYQKAELSNEHARYELPEGLLQELPGERQLHEFPGGQNSHELDGNEYSNGG